MARTSMGRAGLRALFLLGLSAPAGAAARQPFEGFWAADRAGCRDPDSVGRMAIQADTIQWYETRCGIRRVAPAGRGTWRLELRCRGEGQRMAARATLRLPTLDALTIDDGPIGPARRQSYRRCRPADGSPAAAG